MKAKNFWDSHYKNTGINHSFGNLDFLNSMLPKLQKGKVLDLGCGMGASSICLAKNGFQVLAIDASEIAIANLVESSKKNALEIDAKATDLDFFMMGLMTYDSIVMRFFKPPLPRYYSEIIRALKQGGTLLVESFLVDEQPQVYSQDEAYQNFYFQANEVLKNLNGLQILFYQEDLIDGKMLVRCLAQKPLDKDAAKYNLFDMSSGSSEKPKDKNRELAEALFKKN